MLMRCYDSKYQEKYPTYKGCKVEDYLLNFQHMGEWIDENYYEVPGEQMCLDKDILCKLKFSPPFINYLICYFYLIVIHCFS